MQGTDIATMASIGDTIQAILENLARDLSLRMDRLIVDEWLKKFPPTHEKIQRNWNQYSPWFQKLAASTINDGLGVS